jgi:hypothetical protein
MRRKLTSGSQLQGLALIEGAGAIMGHQHHRHLTGGERFVRGNRVTHAGEVLGNLLLAFATPTPLRPAHHRTPNSPGSVGK